MSQAQAILDWLASAAAALPRSSFLIVTHIVRNGSPVTRHDGSTVIAICRTHREFQQSLGLSCTGVSAGILSAARTGWLVRPSRIPPGAPAVYTVPVPANIAASLHDIPVPENGTPQPISTFKSPDAVPITSTPATNDPTSHSPLSADDVPETSTPPASAKDYYASPKVPRYRAIATALAIEGLEGETAVLRDNLLHTLIEHPDWIQLHIKLALAICQLSLAHQQLTRGRKRPYRDALRAMFDEVLRPANVLPPPPEALSSPPSSPAGAA